jgi:hypothetical protein
MTSPGHSDVEEAGGFGNLMFFGPNVSHAKDNNVGKLQTFAALR